MEISEKEAIKAIKLSCTAPANTALEMIANKLEMYSVGDLLFKNEDKQDLYELSHQLHGLFARESNELPSVASLVNVALKYFEQFINSGDLKALVIFVNINCYLKINNSLFWKEKARFKGKKECSNVLAKLIGKLKIKIDIKIDASYYEKSLKEKAVEGFVKNDINQVYDFVLALERGGRGFHINFLLENLLYFYFQFDQNAFVAQLNALKSTEEVMFYLQSFPKTAILILMRDPNLKNHWVIFELMRQLVKQLGNKDLLDKKNIAALSNCLNNLYFTDKSFYSQAVGFLHQNSLFNAALGKQAMNLAEDDIKALFTEWLPISKYDHNLDARTVLLNALDRHLSDNLKALTLRCVFDRWKSLFNNLLDNNDEYINDLFETDFANFVILYYSEGSVNAVLDLMKGLLVKLAWINSEWSSSESHQVKIFHLYFSHLYLLSFAYKNKKLKDGEVSTLLTTLSENTNLPSRITSDHYFNHLSTVLYNVSSK
jgi:hypothetical protein